MDLLMSFLKEYCVVICAEHALSAASYFGRPTFHLNLKVRKEYGYKGYQYVTLSGVEVCLP